MEPVQKKAKTEVEVISLEGEHFKLPSTLPLFRDMLEDCGESEEAMAVPLTSEVLKCFVHYNSDESQRRHLLKLASLKDSPYFKMLPLTKEAKYIMDVLMMNVAADFFCLAEDENLTKAVTNIATSLWHVRSEEIFEILLHAVKDKKLRISPTVAREITRATDPSTFGIQLMVTLFPGQSMHVNYQMKYPNKKTIAVLNEHNCQIEFTAGYCSGKFFEKAVKLSKVAKNFSVSAWTMKQLAPFDGSEDLLPFVTSE